MRFVAEETGQVHLGQVVGVDDIGSAVFAGQGQIKVKLIEGDIYNGVVGTKELTVRQLLSPLSREQVQTIRCLGLNYKDHALEAGLAIPDWPMMFIKPGTTLSGPHPAKIVIHKVAQDDSSDYEAELVVVIGKTGKDISKANAMSHVLGFTCGNDVSARNEQFKSSLPTYSKGLDHSAPIGPVLVRTSEIDHPHALGIKTELNSETMQASNTREMIFDVPYAIEFLSRGTTLERGSIIMMGTPPGIGMAKKPKVWLKHGDVVKVSIEHVGTLINRVSYEQ